MRALRLSYDDNLSKLRNYAQEERWLFSPAMTNFVQYTSSLNPAWTLDKWIKTYHSQITQRKEFFREFIMSSAQNASTAELFLHYREIAGYFNIRFTLTEVYLREYPNEAKLPGGNIVEPNKAGIRAHLGAPDEETEISLVYEDFRFVFDTEGKLQNAELR